ncbi:MAG: 16S rRNA (guanine(966)-N(2))-methyltransferase RsmD [Alicyclobacillaceae bacterium]|nr:16S rRNA (guanine(966)-N(2))-methyltransferase RsmD [Alicyclobacillaceae bacterium]
MRVIAGEWKGHSLVAPVGKAVRPTTDRVKESMFNLLGPNGCRGVVLDLFAGSGALGLEALSRGASHAIFVDSSARSLEVVARNVDHLHARSRCELWRLDWRRALERIASDGVPMDMALVDPPYPANLWTEVVTVLAQSPSRVRVVVLEHPQSVQLSAQVGSLAMDKQRRYGDIFVSIYRRFEDSEEVRQVRESAE